MFAFSGLALLSLVSCQKETVNALVTQDVAATLKVNESYTFVLPTDDNDDPYSITSQASNYRVSQIGTDASGQTVYEYTPSLDFVGTDSVVVSNDHEHGGGCHGDSTHHEGGHGHHGGGHGLLGHHPHRPKNDDAADTHHEITIRFNIVGSNETLVK